MTLDWSRWPHFTESELRCRGQGCCGSRCDMDPDFMDRLERCRTAVGFPLVVASGYRCPTHNCAVASTGPQGPHTTGKAVDIKIHGIGAFRLVYIAAGLFNGLGIKQHGPYEGRFIHLDTISGSGRPWLWSYP